MANNDVDALRAAPTLREALQELIEDSKTLLKTYADAMASQKDHGPDAKLIVMANYGDLCAGRLRAILAALAHPPEGPADYYMDPTSGEMIRSPITADQPESTLRDARRLAAELRGNIAQADWRAWASEVLPMLDAIANSTANSPEGAQPEPYCWQARAGAKESQPVAQDVRIAFQTAHYDLNLTRAGDGYEDREAHAAWMSWKLAHALYTHSRSEAPADPEEGGTCNVCGGLTRYGERHRQCGAAVMKAVREAQEKSVQPADALDALRDVLLWIEANQHTFARHIKESAIWANANRAAIAPTKAP